MPEPSSFVLRTTEDRLEFRRILSKTRRSLPAKAGIARSRERQAPERVVVLPPDRKTERMHARSVHRQGEWSIGRKGLSAVKGMRDASWPECGTYGSANSICIQAGYRCQCDRDRSRRTANRAERRDGRYVQTTGHHKPTWVERAGVLRFSAGIQGS